MRVEDRTIRKLKFENQGYETVAINLDEVGHLSNRKLNILVGPYIL